MCMAIGPLTTPQRGPAGRLWWRLARTPLRLATLVAALHAPVLMALAWHTGPTPELAAALIAGPLGLPLLGLAMQRLPDWAGRSPVHYAAYAGSFLTALLALSLLEAALYTAFMPARYGLALLLLAWLVGLRSLWALRGWVAARRRRAADAFTLGLSALTVALASFVLLPAG